MIASLFVKVNLGQIKASSQEEKLRQNKEELMKLVTPSSLIFFGMILQGGLMWGIRDTYFNVFLQKELGMSSQLIGYTVTISVVSQILILPFAKWIIEGIGHIHICFLAIIVDVARLLVSSYAKQFSDLIHPINLMYGLIWMDSLCLVVYWTSAVKYSYKIAPPTLVGTMAAIANSIQWVIGE